MQNVDASQRKLLCDLAPSANPPSGQLNVICVLDAFANRFEKGRGYFAVVPAEQANQSGRRNIVDRAGIAGRKPRGECSPE
jgi:hypothetical protein